MGGRINLTIDHDGEQIMETHLKKRDEMRAMFFDYLKDFKEYLSEYMRESIYELAAGSLPIRGSVELFDGVTSPARTIIKNQGTVACYVNTGHGSGYRLDPGEKIEFFMNNKICVVVPSGVTTIGFIKS